MAGKKWRFWPKSAIFFPVNNFPAIIKTADSAFWVSGGMGHDTLHVALICSIKGAGGGPRPKIIFNVIFVEGRQSYQMLFTGSKNIDPSRINRIFKIAKYIQLPCGHALYSRLSQNFKF